MSSERCEEPSPGNGDELDARRDAGVHSSLPGLRPDEDEVPWTDMESGLSPSGLPLLLVAAVLACVLLGWGWMTIGMRDRWAERIESLYPRELETVTWLAKRPGDLGWGRGFQEVEARMQQVQELQVVLEATIWMNESCRGGYALKNGVVKPGSWTFLQRTPSPGESTVNVVHQGDREFFQYLSRFPSSAGGGFGFEVTLDAAQVRAAWNLQH